MKKFLLVLLLVGCDKSNSSATPEPSWESKQANNIVYVKDTRTDLCFAVSTVSEYPLGTAIIYTHVPCRDSVEKLIK
jgi:hypothetical protein